MLSKKGARRLKRFISRTPLNKSYIIESSIRYSIKASVSYARGVLLDMGCGERQYEDIFLKRVDRYIGIDIPHSLYDVSKVDAYASGEALPFHSEVFDTVLCTQVLEHIREPSVIVGEISRVLKKEGHLILTAPQSESKHDEPHDYYRYTDHGLKYLIGNNGLTVISVKNHYGNLAMIGQHLSSFVYDKFLIKKGMGRPNIFLAIFFLPMCAIIQSFFLLLDKTLRLETHPVGYTVIAIKER